jgi:hypothetical protein
MPLNKSYPQYSIKTVSCKDIKVGTILFFTLHSYGLVLKVERHRKNGKIVVYYTYIFESGKLYLNYHFLKTKIEIMAC